MPHLAKKSRKRKITRQVSSASQAGRRAGHRGLGRSPILTKPKPRAAQSKTASPQSRVAPKSASVLQRTHQSTVGKSAKRAVRGVSKAYGQGMRPYVRAAREVKKAIKGAHKTVHRITKTEHTSIGKSFGGQAYKGVSRSLRRGIKRKRYRG